MIKTVLGNHSVISHADDRPRRLVERPACCNQGDGRCKVLRKSSTHFGTTTSPLQMDGYTRKPIDCLFDYHVAQGKSLFQAERRLETVTRRVSEGQSTLARSLAHAGYQKPMPDEKNAFSVGRTKDAIRAGTAQTPPLCRGDYAINDVSTCVRSSGNCSVCSVRPTPKAQLQNSRVGLPKWPGSKTDLAIQAENRHSSWGLG